MKKKKSAATLGVALTAVLFSGIVQVFHEGNVTKSELTPVWKNSP